MRRYFYHMGAALLAGISVPALAQINVPLLNTFQQIKVTQQSVFQGKVIFDQGLNMTGNAKFADDIVGAGGLNIAKTAAFAGAINLGQNTAFNGNALFNNNLSTLGNAAFGGQVSMNGLSGGQIGSTYSLIGMSNGQLINIPSANFPTLGSVLGGTPSLCTSVWQYGSNTITATPAQSLTSSPIQGGGAHSDCPNIAVGINTASPTEALDVLGNGKFSGSLVSNRIFAGRQTGAVGANSEFLGKIVVGGNENSANNNVYVQMGFDGYQTYLDGQDPVNSRALAINPYSNLPVTIGTAGSQLNVNGNAFISGKNGWGSVNKEAVINFGDDNHYIKAAWGKGVFIGTFQADKGIFLQQGGNVGIGTGSNSPAARLHVVAAAGTTGDLLLVENGNGGNTNDAFKVKNDGTVYAHEMNVQLGDFPDYVFDKDYKLPSLSETERFIATNHRLPKMPSAEQVKEEGANLGELVRLLVEKNEELTLHVIELRKQVEALKANQK